jgi:hypothetical protein
MVVVGPGLALQVFRPHRDVDIARGFLVHEASLTHAGVFSTVMRWDLIPQIRRSAA